ncbi:MAG: hypothetical protein R3C02_15495 [Planctomycetaceae bacterium]
MQRDFQRWVLLSGVLWAILLAPGLRIRADETVGDPTDALVADAVTVRARQLINQLGASSYQLREEAAVELREMGPAVLPALREASRHDDLEIRYRVRKLRDAIEQIAQNRALTEFLATGDPGLGHAIPGWQRFSEICGNDQSARRLFVEMHEAEPGVMRLTDRSGVELQVATEQSNSRFRRGDRQNVASRMSPATLAVFMFVMLDPGCELSIGTRSMTSAVIGQTQIANAINEFDDSAYRRLMSRWIALADDVSPAHRINVAMQYSFAAGVEPAFQLIHSGARGSHVQTAICAIGKLGGPEHLQDMTFLLEDDSDIAEGRRNGRSMFTSQVRDVALAVMLHLSGQNPSDYGFGALPFHEKYLFQPNTIGFESDEQREQALNQWHLWGKVQRAQGLAIDATAVEGVQL